MVPFSRIADEQAVHQIELRAFVRGLEHGDLAILKSHETRTLMVDARVNWLC